MQEYLSIDSSPQAVLVAGWPGAGFMSQLLWELDKGTYALPPGEALHRCVHVHTLFQLQGTVCKLSWKWQLR